MSSTNLRVRYAETDQMGVAHHANYLIWMEVGRVEACRERGFDYRDMENIDGILLAVTEVNCRYLSPARYDDQVTILTNITEAASRRVAFEYEIFCGDRRLATGETRHVFLNRQMRPTRLPEKYRALFGMESFTTQR